MVRQKSLTLFKNRFDTFVQDLVFLAPNSYDYDDWEFDRFVTSSRPITTPCSFSEIPASLL